MMNHESQMRAHNLNGSLLPLPHYLIRRFLQNILHLHLERRQKAVGPNLMMTCNGESVSVYHVIAYPASIITRPIITTLTSCLHRQFQSLLWSIYTVNSSVLHNIRNSLARALQPFLPYFFPRNASHLVFLSVWWTRRMRGGVWSECVKYECS